MYNNPPGGHSQGQGGGEPEPTNPPPKPGGAGKPQGEAPRKNGLLSRQGWQASSSTGAQSANDNHAQSTAQPVSGNAQQKSGMHKQAAKPVEAPRKGGLLSQAGLQVAKPVEAPRKGGLLSRAGMQSAQSTALSHQSGILAQPPAPSRPLAVPPTSIQQPGARAQPVDTPWQVSVPSQPASGGARQTATFPQQTGSDARHTGTFPQASGGARQTATFPQPQPMPGWPSAPQSAISQQSGRQTASQISGYSAPVSQPLTSPSGRLTTTRTGALPPRKSPGIFGWFKDMERGTKIGLLTGISLLLTVALIGAGMMIGKTTTSTTQPGITLQTTATASNITPAPTLAPGQTPTPTPAPQEGPGNIIVGPTTNPGPSAGPTPTPIVTGPVTPANATATAVASCPPVPAVDVDKVEPTPPNPYCFDFNGFVANAYNIHNPPADFCKTMTLKMPNGNFRCNANFDKQIGFIGLCVDDTWARANGRGDIANACANDGGWEQDLFTHTMAYA